MSMGRTTEKRREALRIRRAEACELFRGGATQAEVAHALQVSRPTAMRWHQAWKRRGAKGLELAECLGRPPQLKPRDLERIDRKLRRGAQALGYRTDLWTLQRVAEVIEATAGVDYHIGHVGRILRSMGWSLQRPTTRARERDEEAIQRWVKVRWPELKKTSDRKG